MRDKHVFLHWEPRGGRSREVRLFEGHSGGIEIIPDLDGTLWPAVVEGIRRSGIIDMPEAEDEEADAEEHMTASQGLAWIANNRADLHWIHLDKVYSHLTVESRPAGLRSIHRAVTEPDIHGFGDALVRAVQWQTNSDDIERRRHLRALGLAGTDR